MNILHIPHYTGRIFLSIFIIYCCLRNDYYKKIFSSAIPYRLGEISFSLYLIHVPLICSFACWIVFYHNNLKGKIIASLLTILVTLLLSVLYTKYIDKKAIAISNKAAAFLKKYSSRAS
jgi:peptidoglycan/LPS O-acetylase OafA/YrhL